MRRKIVTVVAVGALGLTGLAVSAPALAAAAGADKSTVAALSPVERIKKALAGLVSDKTLTQAQADKVASTLAAAGPGHGGPGGMGHDGRGGPGGPGGMHHDLSAAATALGMTEADLRTALESGKSLAQVAKDKGVAVEKLVTALVDAAKKRIAQDVTDKRITQAQADEHLANLTERITEQVNRARPARPKN